MPHQRAKLVRLGQHKWIKKFDIILIIKYDFDIEMHIDWSIPKSFRFVSFKT